VLGPNLFSQFDSSSLAMKRAPRLEPGIDRRGGDGRPPGPLRNTGEKTQVLVLSLASANVRIFVTVSITHPWISALSADHQVRHKDVIETRASV